MNLKEIGLRRNSINLSEDISDEEFKQLENSIRVKMDELNTLQKQYRRLTGRDYMKF